MQSLSLLWKGEVTSSGADFQVLRLIIAGKNTWPAVVIIAENLLCPTELLYSQYYNFRDIYK